MMGQKWRLKCLIIVTIYPCIQNIIRYHTICFNVLDIDDEYLDLNILTATISMVKFLKVGQC